MFKMSLFRSAILAFLALLLTPGATRPLSRRAAPLPPADDPFYQPPPGYQNTAPGTILRNRTIAAGFFGLVPEPVQAYQLLYRTTAINGTPIATVTTIFKPSDAALDRFVSFHTAYDSSATQCDPSYDYQEGSQQNNEIVGVEELAIQGLLLSGYLVAAPDYEGPDAAFSPGHLEGMGVLDGMRAVQNFKTLGLSTNPAIVGVGYSGGAIASGWAASLQKSYAPSLNIKGWASGGTPANLTGTAVYLDGALFSGFLPVAVDGLLKPSAYQAQLQPIVNSIITAKGASVLANADATCGTNVVTEYPFLNFTSTEYQSLGNRLFYQPTIAAILKQNIMGIYANQTPIAPVLLYHASNDEIIPYANVTTLDTNWCNQGATVKFDTYLAGGHVTTEILGYPALLAFVTSAFAGAVTPGCQSLFSSSSTLNATSLGSKFELLLTEMNELLTKYGEGDSNLIANLSSLW